jgi:hypothetical protein
MSGICMDCEPLSIGDVSFGVTDAAMKFFSFLQDDVETHTRSVTAPIRKTEDILSGLIEIQEECSHDDWDDEGTVAISFATLFEAMNFIRLLPAHLKLPDVVPSANGAINFEWRKDDYICNVELSGTNEIVYSAYFSKINRDYGMKPYFGKIPNKVIELIESMS